MSKPLTEGKYGLNFLLPGIVGMHKPTIEPLGPEIALC